MKSRLFVEQPLAGAQQVSLSAGQAHYLNRVIRLREGGRAAVFNGQDGEWIAELQGGGKRMRLKCIKLIRAQTQCPDVWLLLTPLRRARTEFAVEKAVELGVSRIVFVSTARAAERTVNIGRLRAIAIEAAEQCGGMNLPRIDGIRPLAAELKSWPQGRRLLFCDEEAATGSFPFPAPSADAGNAVLIGPEGGFTERERNLVGAFEFSVRVSLGSRILRAETAAVAALALLNAGRGSAAPPPVLAAQDSADIQGSGFAGSGS